MEGFSKAGSSRAGEEARAGVEARPHGAVCGHGQPGSARHTGERGGRETAGRRLLQAGQGLRSASQVSSLPCVQRRHRFREAASYCLECCHPNV